MPDDLSVAFERLRNSAQHLNLLCDKAAQLVRDVEQFLEETRVGVSASVTLGHDATSPDAGTPEWEDKLSYRRVDSGKFRIALVREYVYAPPEEAEVSRPWSEGTRDEKLNSLEHLPALLIELAKRVDDRAARAEKALSAVGPLLQLPAKRKGG